MHEPGPKDKCSVCTVSGAHDNSRKLICYASHREIMLSQSRRIRLVTKEIKKQEGTICQAFNSSPVTHKGFHFKIEKKKKV